MITFPSHLHVDRRISRRKNACRTAGHNPLRDRIQTTSTGVGSDLRRDLEKYWRAGVSRWWGRDLYKEERGERDGLQTGRQIVQNGVSIGIGGKSWVCHRANGQQKTGPRAPPPTRHGKGRNKRKHIGIPLIFPRLLDTILHVDAESERHFLVPCSLLP